MRLKILDLSDGLDLEDTVPYWVEPWDALPTMDYVDIEEFGPHPPNCENIERGCQRSGVFRMTQVVTTGPQWFHYCEHCMMLILRSSAILAVRP